jgi:hypothetical protein
MTTGQREKRGVCTDRDHSNESGDSPSYRSSTTQETRQDRTRQQRQVTRRKRVNQDPAGPRDGSAKNGLQNLRGHHTSDQGRTKQQRRMRSASNQQNEANKRARQGQVREVQCFFDAKQTSTGGKIKPNPMLEAVLKNSRIDPPSMFIEALQVRGVRTDRSAKRDQSHERKHDGYCRTYAIALHDENE